MDGCGVLLVMNKPNICMNLKDKIAAFKKGLLVQRLHAELLKDGLVNDIRTIAVCWVCQVENGAMHGLQDKEGGCAVWEPSPQDEYEWGSVVKGREFEEDQILVKIQLRFSPDDTPLGMDTEGCVQQWLHAANKAIRPPSVLQSDLNTHGAFLVVLPLPLQPSLPDHPDNVAAMAYCGKMDASLSALEMSHKNLVSSLCTLKTAQQQIIASIVSGKPWAAQAASYAAHEQDVLEVAAAGHATATAESTRDIAYTTESVRCTPFRQTVGSERELVKKTLPATNTFRKHMLPSEHHLKLRELESIISN
eukprot:TRINITY_DN23533_c0_g1_i1.p1 TRINITY_DN23533_c0_g1~~TRINITY_DN23533_c0_g1_i1.p1  ORF type:complete len:306 (+),score=74.22 TRINITY_DN23533_c0_g1_i1:76-993(+)